MLLCLLAVALATVCRYPPVHIYRYFSFYINPVASAGSTDLLRSVTVNYAENPFGHSQHRINWITLIFVWKYREVYIISWEICVWILCQEVFFFQNILQKSRIRSRKSALQICRAAIFIATQSVIAADYRKPMISIAVGAKQMSTTQSAQLAIASASRCSCTNRCGKQSAIETQHY